MAVTQELGNDRISCSVLDRRIEMLGEIKRFISETTEQILEALWKDLRKPRAEAMLTEIRCVKDEINYAVKHLHDWAQPTNIAPHNRSWGKYSTIPQPLGNVLIISAWNYPFQLSLLPVVNAIAAGNSVVLKPSENAPATAMVLQSLEDYLGSERFKVACGGKDCVQKLIRRGFDHVFFTGGSEAGKEILKLAANSLTSVTVELGGKCPVVVDDEVDLDYVARRIVWAKALNAGQTCIAPDHVFVHSRIADLLMERIDQTATSWCDRPTQDSEEMGQIVNAQHFDRIGSILQRSGFALPDYACREKLYLPFTSLFCDDFECALLTEEIFGPVLPVVRFDQLDDVIDKLATRPKPLAIYCFSSNHDFHVSLMNGTDSGGYCVNDIMMHAVDPAVPFGGVGSSGFGRYRGKAGFDCFSNQRAIFENLQCREDKRVYPSPR